MTVLLGTLSSSIKQIEAPYEFDWENAIALDTMQGNRASSRREGKVSLVFSSCGRNMDNHFSICSLVALLQPHIVYLQRIKNFINGILDI